MKETIERQIKQRTQWMSESFGEKSLAKKKTNKMEKQKIFDVDIG